MPCAEISAAFATLSDAEKRRHYDQVGDEDENVAAQHAAYGARYRGGMQGQYMTPEDIFEMFFSGEGFRPAGVRRRNVHVYR